MPGYDTQSTKPNHPRPATWLQEVPKCTTTTHACLSLSLSLPPSLSFRFLFLIEQDEPLMLRRKRKYESEGLLVCSCQALGNREQVSISHKWLCMPLYASTCRHAAHGSSRASRARGGLILVTPRHSLAHWLSFRGQLSPARVCFAEPKPQRFKPATFFSLNKNS